MIYAINKSNFAVSSLSIDYNDCCVFNNTVYIATNSGVATLTGTPLKFSITTGDVFLHPPSYTIEMNFFDQVTPSKVTLKTDKHPQTVELTPTSNKVHLPRGLLGNYITIGIESTGEIHLFELLLTPSKRNV